MPNPLAQLPGYTLSTPAASAPPAPPLPTSAKSDALAVAGQIQASPLVDRLHDLYRRAAAGQLADRLGRRWRGLTDYEAAAYLGVERTSVNAARNALVEAGHVGKLRRRLCRFRPSGQQVWSWALVTVTEERP